MPLSFSSGGLSCSLQLAVLSQSSRCSSSAAAGSAQQTRLLLKPTSLIVSRTDSLALSVARLAATMEMGAWI